MSEISKWKKFANEIERKRTNVATIDCRMSIQKMLRKRILLHPSWNYVFFLPKRNRCTIWKNSPPKFAIFALRNIRTAIVLFQMRKHISAKLSLRTRTSTHMLQNCFEVEARLVNMQNIKNNHG